MEGLSYHGVEGCRLPDRNSEYINSQTQVGAPSIENREWGRERGGGGGGEGDRVESNFEGHILGSYA